MSPASVLETLRESRADTGDHWEAAAIIQDAGGIAGEREKGRVWGLWSMELAGLQMDGLWAVRKGGIQDDSKVRLELPAEVAIVRSE